MPTCNGRANVKTLPTSTRCTKLNICRQSAWRLLQDVLTTNETSVNLTSLTPFTNYTVSISCIVAEAAHGYWSDESETSAQTAQYGCITALL